MQGLEHFQFPSCCVLRITLSLCESVRVGVSNTKAASTNKKNSNNLVSIQT